MLVHRPIEGVTVVRVAGARPLMRAVPERYGTTMQLAGRSHWTTGREAWSSAPGSVGVKVPGEVTVERAREGELVFQIVLFDTSLVEDALGVLGRPMPSKHGLDSRDPRWKPLRTLHRRFLDSSTPAAPAAPFASAAYEELLCEALHAFVDVVSTPGRPWSFSAPVVRARALLDERVTETVSLDELATHARLDKFRLCRAFREQIGLPPHTYVTHRRVALAQELLARGVPQAEVAARVGFYDQSLLHRHFKRIVGLTPGAFASVAGITRTRPTS